MAVYDQAGALKEMPIYGSQRIGMIKALDTDGQFTHGNRQYEYSNHLGNVLAVSSDKMVKAGGEGDLISASNYYPFGLRIDDRSMSSDGYRYGFNGKEDDRDFSNGQLIQDYGFRLYNPALGKFLSVDPLTKEYPWYTPYQFAGNKPIAFIDLDGLEEVDPLIANKLLYDGTSVDMSKAPTKVRTLDDTRWVYTKTNAMGEKRNHAYYWNEVYKNNPDAFSKKNVANIKKGFAPVVDKKWIDHFPEHEKWFDQKLEHHHKNHGKNAFALPWKAHRGKGNYKIWHYSTKKLNQLKKAAGKSSLGAISPFADPTEWSGYLAGRTDSDIHRLEGLLNPRVGELYENQTDHLPGKYFIIREKHELKDNEGNIQGYNYTVDYYNDSDGYQTPNEDSFINQRTYLENSNGQTIY